MNISKCDTTSPLEKYNSMFQNILALEFPIRQIDVNQYETVSKVYSKYYKIHSHEVFFRIGCDFSLK